MLLCWLTGSASTPVSDFIVLIQQTTNQVPESHTGLWDHLDDPADKSGVSGVTILNELRPFCWTDACK